PAERLREGVEKPVQRRNPMWFLARLVDFAVGPRDERLKVTPRLRLGSECRDLREAGGSALVEVMKVLQLFEAWLERGIVRQPVQDRFQFTPMRLFGCDEFPKVDDHRNQARQYSTAFIS